MDGKTESRWVRTSPWDSVITIALKTDGFKAYEGMSSELVPPGPRSGVGTDSQLHISAMCVSRNAVMTEICRFLTTNVASVKMPITPLRSSHYAANTSDRLIRELSSGAFRRILLIGTTRLATSLQVTIKTNIVAAAT